MLKFIYRPLARVELGKDKVQGMDYAYTINGWLKAMNGSLLDPSNDMGSDGVTGYLAGNTDVHTLVARDVLSYNLGYFDGDYTAISSFAVENPFSGSTFESAGPGLYNGNIRHTVSSIYGMGIETFGAAYQYDQLNRLKEMNAFEYNTSTSLWSGMSNQEYHNEYTYDRNGNIKSLVRNGEGTSLLMDDFAYHYFGLDGLENTDPTTGVPLSVSPSNRLNYVVDTGADDGTSLEGDIKAGQSTDNYEYDELGQLVVDVSEGIQSMIWRKGDKKLKKIERDNANGADVPDVEFIYNPFGIRVVKIEKPRTAGVPSSPDEWNYTYYAYDANGQCMATYDVTMSTGQNEAILAEQHIYGSSRIGMLKQKDLIYDDGPIPPPSSSMANMYSNWAGERRYEINNYLGNVNAVLTDRKIPTSTGVPTLFEAVVVHATDYFTFGMVMPDRDLPFDPDGEEYRYAYNGMEQDNEVSGNGNSYTTGSVSKYHLSKIQEIID
ncbi:MAG: hypothetical protein A3D92_11745 [Bacteroidetes bacterium RIFCSPHIGHO2_02_FULL_44_7]|nr:MAG: hypothetical protein A3D92_11745 [Bacteroidetes bacterium RIFCSPHIGHO2_02_FULL_44_7]